MADFDEQYKEVLEREKKYLEHINEPKFKAYRINIGERLYKISNHLCKLSDTQVVLFGLANLQWHKDNYYQINRNFVEEIVERLESALAECK